MGRRGIAWALVSASAAWVAGCAPGAPTHDVAFYRSHTDDRQRQLSVCSKDPGSRQSDPDCLNAMEAERLEGIGSLRELPPVGLPTNPKQAGN